MPWNVSRTANTLTKEILMFPAGLDAIQSVVLKASGAPTLSSAVTNGVSGIRGYRAGQILKAVSGDSQGRLQAYSGSGTPLGVLTDNVYFYDGTAVSDEPAAMFFHGVVFNATRLTGYSGNETAVKAALSTCRFEVGDDW